ncbi:MAG TPA: ABC transporter substrate-binding protein [Actinomycetota bacterium]|nr:ABC transporter substrate-binding protein [Actinomycetota bacterium]
MPPRSGWRGRGAAALALALVAGGCTGDAARRPERERPPPRGTIRLAYPEVPPTLNPVTDGSAASRDILRPVLPSFHLVEPDLDYRPWLLAREPEVRTDGDRMTVRFRIRAGAMWSDGTPIGVDDVAFTWRVMSDPELDVARPEGFEHVIDVVEESERTGTLVLSPPLRTWRELFSAGRFVLPSHVADGPRSVERWDRGPPVGAGPFTIGGLVPGRSVILEANPRFWGPAPLIRSIEVVFVPDPTTALQLLREGLVDAVAPALGVSWRYRLGRLPEVRSSSGFGPDVVCLVIEAGRMERAAERRHVARAVDRARFVQAVIRNEGRLANGVVVPEQPGAEATWAALRPEAGQRGLPRASADGELSLAYVRGELLDITARFIQRELIEAGLDVELVPVESDVFHGVFLPDRRYDLALVEIRSGPAPELSWWFDDPDGPSPLSALEDPELPRLEEAWDRRRSAEALAAAQGRLAGLTPVLPLFQPRVTMGWRAGVRGLRANPTVDGPLWNAWAWTKQ